MKMIRVLTVLILLANSSCSGPHRDTQQSAPFAADSLVLERSLCFGTCPAYRLRVNSRGEVHFQSRNPGDGSRVATDTLAVSEYAWLLHEADRIGFDTFPDTIASSRSLCSVVATDHPTTTMSVFWTHGAKRIEYYTGCFTDGGDSHDPARRLLQLSTLAASVDSVTRAARWIRPAPSPFDR